MIRARPWREIAPMWNKRDIGTPKIPEAISSNLKLNSKVLVLPIVQRSPLDSNKLVPAKSYPMIKHLIETERF